MLVIKTKFLLLIFAACIGLAFSQAVIAAKVRIAVAANFTTTMKAIAKDFEHSSGHKTIISFGSTGKLFSHIENGAPFEIFLAADSQRPIKAEQQGLAVPGSRFVYARGKLVLWSPKQTAFRDGVTYLKDAAFTHLAIANPKIAPYGLASQEVMEHLVVWKKIRSKLVYGDSIAQTFQFVASGNAEAGFVAAAQIIAWPEKALSIWNVPAEYYTPLDQSAVLLKRGATNPAAHAFLDYLKSKTAHSLIRRYGYDIE